MREEILHEIKANTYYLSAKPDCTEKSEKKEKWHLLWITLNYQRKNRAVEINEYFTVFTLIW